MLKNKIYKSNLNLLDLPNEIFYYHIFPFILKNNSLKYSTTSDYLFLTTLKYVCKRFYYLIKSKNTWVSPINDLNINFIFDELKNKSNLELQIFDYSIWTVKKIYNLYVLKSKYDLKIINLFDNFEDLYNLPYIDLSSVIYSFPKSSLHDIFFFREYIDYIEPHHLQYPIMRGSDIYDRPVICIKYYNRRIRKYYVETIFRKYAEFQKSFLWTTGASSGNKMILNSGNYNLLNETSINYLKRLIYNKKCGQIYIDSNTKKYYEEDKQYEDGLGTIVIHNNNLINNKY